MSNDLFSWDELTPNPKTAPKKLVSVFKRAGAEIASSWVGDKTKRENSISYREICIALADSQQLVLRVKSTGDIYQVRLNGKVVPIKEQDDVRKSIAEIIQLAEANSTRFQKALARKKVVMPKGIKSTTKRKEEAFTSELDELDQLIAEADAEIARLKEGGA